MQAQLKPVESSERLEAAFQMPQSLTFDTEVATEEGLFVFRVSASPIHVEGDCLRVDEFALSKSRKVEVMRRRIASWIPFRTEEYPVEVCECIWQVNVRSCGTFVLSSEKPVTDRTHSFGIRSKFVGALANRNILVSDTLLDRMIGPLESKAMEILRIVNRFPSFS